jgi:Leucine-rich repeat (LRR) protein
MSGGLPAANPPLLTSIVNLPTHLTLQELRVAGNQLRLLRPEIGMLTQLRVLAADSNQITILPGEQSS